MTSMDSPNSYLEHPRTDITYGPDQQITAIDLYLPFIPPGASFIGFDFGASEERHGAAVLQSVFATQDLPQTEGGGSITVIDASEGGTVYVDSRRPAHPELDQPLDVTAHLGSVPAGSELTVVNTGSISLYL